MLKWEPHKLKDNEYFKLPKWFMEWFIIISKLKSDIYERVELCLEKWYVWTAIEIFEEQTKENIDLKWH